MANETRECSQGLEEIVYCISLGLCRSVITFKKPPSSNQNRCNTKPISTWSSAFYQTS